MENKCNICFKTNFKTLYKNNYVICKDCGHVYQIHRDNLTHYHELPYESQWDDYINIINEWLFKIITNGLYREWLSW